MTAYSDNQTQSGWRPQKREVPVRLYLTGVDGDTADLVGVRAAGLPLELNLVPVTDWIDPDELNGAAAAVIQVDSETPASVKRFQKLAKVAQTPLIAAAYDPPLSLVRALLRSGACDVLPLPLELGDVEASLRQIQEQNLSAAAPDVTLAPGKTKIVSILKAIGDLPVTTIPSAMGHPRDECHAISQNGSCAGGRMGNGVWDANAYFRTNYVRTVATANGGAGNGTPSRVAPISVEQLGTSSP